MPRKLVTTRAGKVKQQTPKVAKAIVGRQDVGKAAMRKKSAVRNQTGLTHINSKVNRDKRKMGYF